MIPEKLLAVLKQDGVVAIATLGEEGALGTNGNSRLVMPDPLLFS